MKKTDLAKSDAKKLMGQMGPKGGNFGAASAAAPDRRAQRERERALGLVPFAVKLDSELAGRLQQLAREGDGDMNQLVADLLRQGLAAK
ncbi:hypothetical protein [Massilia sp. H6]|uniref:hypothetical protein n=1 Tax=Massilia sp. H6 TaxID=2970464 RepID=UPI00216A504E|nr:hypothetical protein [Massilia sp. H6]UVW27164.1 hypothetical protein NRS07_11355 [Massilia sp. H6]